jgi:DNA-binding CsgD family transcriptional regulator
VCNGWEWEDFVALGENGVCFIGAVAGAGAGSRVELRGACSWIGAFGVGQGAVVGVGEWWNVVGRRQCQFAVGAADFEVGEQAVAGRLVDELAELRLVEQGVAVLLHLALALGGRPGARLCGVLAGAVSRMTLLRLIRAMPEPEVGPLQVVGVDEWAFRKGRNYGTILVDMATRRPVDLLPEATSDALASWLVRHPGVEVVCRDRAGYFADGARRGAPDAIQVADRWHLLANLSTAVERVIRRCRSCLRDKPNDQIRVLPTPEATPAQGPLAQRIRQRQPQIQQMIAQGWTISAISRELNLDRKTVRRYARRDIDDLMSTATNRGSLIDAFVPICNDAGARAASTPRSSTPRSRPRAFAGAANWCGATCSTGASPVSLRKHRWPLPPGR